MNDKNVSSDSRLVRPWKESPEREEIEFDSSDMKRHDEARIQQLKKKQTTLEEQKENQRDQHQLQPKSFDSNL